MYLVPTNTISLPEAIRQIVEHLHGQEVTAPLDVDETGDGEIIISQAGKPLNPDTDLYWEEGRSVLLTGLKNNGPLEAEVETTPGGARYVLPRSFWEMGGAIHILLRGCLDTPPFKWKLPDNAPMFIRKEVFDEWFSGFRENNPDPADLSAGEQAPGETIAERNQRWYEIFNRFASQQPRPTNESIFRAISEQEFRHDGMRETVKAAVNGIRRGKSETNRSARR